MPRTTKDVTKLTSKKNDEDTKVKKVTKKTEATKKTTAKKDAIKKTTASKKKVDATKKPTKNSSKTKKIEVFEYYDLPYHYNQTTVKILAQTPEMLYVYWDISDDDRLLYISKYGKNFFSITKPVLLVHNKTMNYTFEVEINDFANSWYLHVNDANCEYLVELGRRPNLYQETLKEPYIYVASSNQMDAPNNHILFEHFNPNVTYRNVKTGEIVTKDFSHLSNLKNMQEIYGIYDLYKQIYKNELFDEIVDGNVINPSSFSSCSFQ